MNLEYKHVGTKSEKRGQKNGWNQVLGEREPPPALAMFDIALVPGKLAAVTDRRYRAMAPITDLWPLPSNFSFQLSAFQLFLHGSLAR